MTSLRLAAHLARKAGNVSAAEGLARALARNASPVQAIAAIPAADLSKSMTATQRGAVATTLPKQGVVPANPKPKDRAAIVASAIAKDPALKGKAAEALEMLADDDFAQVTGEGIIKLMKAGATASTPAPVARKVSAPSKASTPTRKAVSAPKAASLGVWEKAIARMGRPAALDASRASMAPWETVIGRMQAVR